MQNERPNDFRRYLEEELASRCRSNPSYSLRAFAKSLRVEASFLSKLLTGKRSVTAATVRRIGERLALDPMAIANFEEGLRKGKRAGGPSASPADEYRNLALDHFRMIADWYHYAILELTETEGFDPSPRAVARALGITVNEARIAVSRLVRLGFLEEGSGGTLTAGGASHTNVGTPYAKAAFRKLQRQVLEGAIRALEDVPLEERDQSSVTMAIDSRRMEEAKAELKRFRRAFSRKFRPDAPKRGEKRDRVYQLSLSFYPVSQVSQPQPQSKKE